MQERSIAQFVGFAERDILHHSRVFYVLRVGGFIIGVVTPLLVMLWSAVTGKMKVGVFIIAVLVALGFAGFILSFRAPAFCKLCGRRLNQYASAETRQGTRYSGIIVTCDHCRAYEPRLSAEFDH